MKQLSLPGARLSRGRLLLVAMVLVMCGPAVRAAPAVAAPVVAASLEMMSPAAAPALAAPPEMTSLGAASAPVAPHVIAPPAATRLAAAPPPAAPAATVAAGQGQVAKMTVVEHKDVSGQVYKKLGLPERKYCWDACLQEERCSGVRWGVIEGEKAGLCLLMTGPLTLKDPVVPRTEDGKRIRVTSARKDAVHAS